MASVIYNTFLSNLAAKAINVDTDAFKVMLVTSTYTPNVDTHNDRADVTNQVTGAGYTAGGNTVNVTATLNTANDRVDIVLPGTTWPTSTITARGAVYYLDTGTAGTDLLVCYIDFVTDKSSSSDTFTLTQSTIQIQNNNAS